MNGVAELAEAVARSLGLTETEVEQVRIAAALHDVGKMAIPDAILYQAGQLDNEEWAFVRRHTLIGETIMHAAPALRGPARLVRSSHERFDGSGYPDGLAGGEIPLGSRIIFVCDAFDAMLSARPYSPPLPLEHALGELRRNAGTQFDPLVVGAFTLVVDERPGRARRGRSGPFKHRRPSADKILMRRDGFIRWLLLRGRGGDRSACARPRRGRERGHVFGRRALLGGRLGRARRDRRRARAQLRRVAPRRRAARARSAQRSRSWPRCSSSTGSRPRGCSSG